MSEMEKPSSSDANETPSELWIGQFIRRDPNIQLALQRFIELGDLTAQFGEMMRNLKENLKIELSDIQRGTSALFHQIGRHFGNANRAQKILNEGWVPYAGMPIEEISERSTSSEIHEFMNTLIRDRWTEVRDCLMKTVVRSKVDEEAVATFKEALDGFAHHHYRSVVRVLFPEIERVARDTVYGGSRRDWSIQEGKEKRSLNTGLGALRESLMEHLPAGLGMYADFGFALTQKMDSHLYRYVGSSPEDLAAMQSDPVPNRHASQHGYVIYSSAQNAYNALCMTAFMFETIMRVNGYLEEKA